MSNTYNKSFFDGFNYEDIYDWTLDDCKCLVGSAIFSKNNNIISKLICWFEKFKCKDKNFIPSHVGSIIEYENELYVFDMKPLFAKKTLLADYLTYTNDDFVIIVRDFVIDTKRYSDDILKHKGEFYPFLSALRSIGTKIKTEKSHCSELHLKALQKQGLFLNINPEITPDELYHLLTEKK